MEIINIHQATTNPRTPGRLAGQIKIAENFDKIDEQILRLFEGEAGLSFYNQPETYL